MRRQWYDLRHSWKTPRKKKYSSYTQTCYGVWNSTVRDSLVWVFQSFQLKHKNFWKGLHLILLKLYQIIFLVYSILGVRLWRMEPQEAAWRTATRTVGQEGKVGRLLITLSTCMYPVFHSWLWKMHFQIHGLFQSTLKSMKYAERNLHSYFKDEKMESESNEMIFPWPQDW